MTRRSRCAGLLTGLLLYVAGAAGHERAAGAARPPRLALLVGISRYPQTGQRPWRALHAHEELVALRKVLVERHGFAERDVQLLEDADAGAQSIRAAVAAHLFARAQRGAVVFFHFSGHGQQVEDRSGDEDDGVDESIVPGDATEQDAGSGLRQNILDDEIAGWLRALSQRMRGPDGAVEGSIVLSFDSCFSGTLSRGDLTERGRGWERILDGPRPARRTEPRPGAGHPPAPLLDLDPRDYVLLSATRSDQTAQERLTEQGTMGVYSAALVSALWRLPLGVSYRALLHELTVQMRQKVDAQTPELEGDAERRLFGARQGPAGAPYLTVQALRGEELELSVGALQQVTVGSVYALYPGDARVPAGRQAPPGAAPLLAEAEVGRVEPLKSWLRLRPRWRGQVAEDALLRAQIHEQEHAYPDSPLRVLCLHEGGGPCRSAGLSQALARLAARGLVTKVDAAGAVPAATDYDIKIVAGTQTLALYRPESGQAFATVPVENEAAGAQTLAADGQASEEAGGDGALVARLRAAWRWQRLYGLRAHSPAVTAELRIVPVTGTRDSRGLVPAGGTSPQWAQAGQRVVLPPGALFQLAIKNPSPVPVWVTVLELGPDGSIRPLYPRPDLPGDGQIAPGEAPRLLSYPYYFETTAPLGTYTLKLVVTEAPADFSLLAQEASARPAQDAAQRGTPLPARSAAHPLGALLREALTGNLVRGLLRPIESGGFSVSEALLEVGTPAAEGR